MRTIEWNGHAGPALDAKKGFDVIECSSCRFRHIIPIPTDKELETVYREEYYSTEKPLYFQHHREDLEWWNMVYDERYATLESLLPPARRRILDVGSGPGFFLARGQGRGWTTLGIEPSRQAAAHARELGLDIRQEFLTTETAAALGTFDAVHLHEVLEHIPDPAAMVRLAGSLLAPGGVLVVIVPNDYSPFQRVLREELGHEPWWVAPPHHVNYFDVASLAGLARRCGLEVVRETATFPIDLFLLFGDNYVGNDGVGRAVHAKRKRMELALARGAPGLRERIYERLASLSIGREAVVYARKPER